MGSASSVNVQTKCIYISYDYREKNNLYIRVLRDRLRQMNLNVIYSEITYDSLTHLSSREISANITHLDI